MTADITLYHDLGWSSPYAFTAFVALKEKGLPFETKAVALKAGEQKQPGYRDASLTAKIPAIQHGDFWLSESAAIAEYLDEAFPAPKYQRLFPAGVKERARARQVMHWVRTDMAPLREERPSSTLWGEKKTAPLGEKATYAAEKLLRVTESLLDGGKQHVNGDFGIADADLAFMLMRLVTNGDTVPEAIKAYADRVWNCPSIQAFVKLPR